MEYMSIKMLEVIKGGQWVEGRHYYWPAPNTVGRVPKSMGTDAIARGMAVEVDDPDAPFPGTEYTESP